MASSRAWLQIRRKARWILYCVEALRQGRVRICIYIYTHQSPKKVENTAHTSEFFKKVGHWGGGVPSIYVVPCSVLLPRPPCGCFPIQLISRNHLAQGPFCAYHCIINDRVKQTNLCRPLTGLSTRQSTRDSPSSNHPHWHIGLSPE